MEGLEPPFDVALRGALTAVRLALARRIKAVLPGQTGAIAVSLIIGYQGEVDEKTLNAMRASGLAHVLSVSGLHMTLVAGSVYWLVRWLLALVPALALRFPIKPGRRRSRLRRRQSISLFLARPSPPSAPMS